MTRTSTNRPSEDPNPGLERIRRPALALLLACALPLLLACAQEPGAEEAPSEAPPATGAEATGEGGEDVVVEPTAPPFVLASPGTVCSYLADEGFDAGPWEPIGEGYSSCQSPLEEPEPFDPEDIGVEPMIRYTASGDASGVQELDLLLEVPETDEEGEIHGAHQRLTALANELSRKAIGNRLPTAVANAIATGADGRWEYGNAEVVVVRSPWSTGNGYDVEVSVRPLE